MHILQKKKHIWKTFRHVLLSISLFITPFALPHSQIRILQLIEEHIIYFLNFDKIIETRVRASFLVLM